MLNSINITKIIDSVLDKPNSKCYVVMEYCNGGNLA